MIKVDRSLPVVYKYAPVFVGWLMVYDKNASVLSDITNFDINVNFGYFTTTQSDHPEAATAWFNVYIDPDFLFKTEKPISLLEHLRNTKHRYLVIYMMRHRKKEDDIFYSYYI